MLTSRLLKCATIVFTAIGCADEVTTRLNQDASGDIRVLALDCEIGIPAYYTVQTQDNNSVSFFSPRLDEVGRIRIDNDADEPTDNLHFRILSTRKVAHLTMAEIEYLGFEERQDSPTYIAISSRNQRLTLFGDATRLAEKLIRECAATVSEADLNVYKRSEAGCAYVLRLNPDYDSVFDSAKISTFYTSDGARGWQLSNIELDGPLARHGVTEGDRISHLCGIPFAEYVVSGGKLCCETGDPESLTLTIQRPGAAKFDIRIPRPSP